ncbi:Transcription factor gte12 [Thalictrum thalictroides]|uniref:Transcription factor gte12 n=1 Tax=Thalictrum thalictroides TaxID=46969 RepID=A0A7J6WKP9_THATH|nr:Transcription factor gte12 [Thalictrum thalictroides]
MQSSVSHGNNKRGPVRKLESQQAKKQKIDSEVMMQCLALLNKLINDKRGWGFRNPVDPVVLNIPDYFSVISKPMDLGTIKSKLEKELYTKTEEFAADVRLTFNNAMLYNPLANYFHVVAKELREIFESRLKVLESKWSAERLRATQQLNLDERLITTLNMKQDTHRSSQASCPKISENVSTTSVPRSCLHSRSAEAAHTQNSSGRNSLQKDLHEGIGYRSRQASGSVSNKSRKSSACINGSCKRMNSRVSHHNSFSNDSKRSSAGENSNACHVGVRNLGPWVNVTASRQMTKANSDSNGDVCVIAGKKFHPSSRPSAPGNDAALDEGWENSLYDGHLSPSKALHAAMLRSRFADTIVKAQQETLLNNGGKSDLVKLKQEKERLEKQQREEKARIEAHIRAAKAASRMKKEMELKMQRQQEREAARIALEKMERTVEICENLDIMKDLEILAALPVKDNILAHRLERQGLFMKYEYLEDEEELESCSQVVEVEHCNINLKVENCSADLNLENNNADVEEGEIVEL